MVWVRFGVFLAAMAIRSVPSGARRSLVTRGVQVNVPPMLPTIRDCALRVAMLRQPISVAPGIAMASASAAPSLPRAPAIAVSAKPATQVVAPVLAVPRVRPAKTDSAAAQIPALAVATSLDATEIRPVPALLTQRAEAHVSVTRLARMRRSAPPLPIALQIASV